MQIPKETSQPEVSFLQKALIPSSVKSKPVRLCLIIAMMLGTCNTQNRHALHIQCKSVVERYNASALNALALLLRSRARYL